MIGALGEEERTIVKDVRSMRSWSAPTRSFMKVLRDEKPNSEVLR